MLADIPQFGQPLKAFNAELMHNIYLLFQARNNAAHKWNPVLNLIHTKDEIVGVDEDTERLIEKHIPVSCPIKGWMVYSEMRIGLCYADVNGDFGSFVWDVLALIEWLRVKVGGYWTKPSVEHYWNEQATRPVGTREQEILLSTLDL